jgi:hypothetical protein
VVLVLVEVLVCFCLFFSSFFSGFDRIFSAARTVADADQAQRAKAAAEKAEREKAAEANETEEEKSLQSLYDYFKAERKAEMTKKEIEEEEAELMSESLSLWMESSLKKEEVVVNTWGGLCGLIVLFVYFVLFVCTFPFICLFRLLYSSWSRFVPDSRFHLSFRCWWGWTWLWIW